MTPLTLNQEFQDTLSLLEQSSVPIFITGRAGTGKSTLLQLFRRTTRKNVIVLAPTGVSALNVSGQTIHSFFGFPPRLFDKTAIRRKKNKIFKTVETIIIDEISMVRADLLDAIDYFMRLHRHPLQPFGGVQMVFFGDLFQLPPVVTKDTEQYLHQMNYASPYFFSAKAFYEIKNLQLIELTKVFRQESRRFVGLLDAIRLNRAEYDELAELNSRHQPTFNSEDFYITLTSRNAIADSLNQKKLSDLSGESQTYIASISGNFDENIFPTDPALKLKVGSQVMFLRNDPERQFVNGTIGIVSSLGADKIIVETQENGKNQRIEVVPLSWETIRYTMNDDEKIETETVGSFTQIPLKLAWAITIHKSQGKTFDKVAIDLGTG
ncbi:MAG: AAA family ATPase, partial [Saprospiraceae bacterium]|nr:AAA family ATPase [Saprospiraceae bacterium]